MFQVNRYPQNETQANGILPMAIHFEPTAGSAVDFLGACQVKLSFRADLKPASDHVSPKSFAAGPGRVERGYIVAAFEQPVSKGQTGDAGAGDQKARHAFLPGTGLAQPRGRLAIG
jgi:hypothetical protein